MLNCYNSTALNWYQHDQNGIIIYLPESQDNCGSGGMLFTATRAQMAPPPGYRQPSVSDSIWSSPGVYGRLTVVFGDNNTLKKCLQKSPASMLPGLSYTNDRQLLPAFSENASGCKYPAKAGK
jgi:hypothetical protein